jgi:hypothetical protein
MLDQMDRGREYESTLANEDNSVMWSKIIKIGRALSRDVLNKKSGKDIFDGTFYLMHIDLAPRNIMAKVSTERTVKITGIVDWDSACFVPYCIAMKAPSWAWGLSSTNDAYHGTDYSDDEADNSDDEMDDLDDEVDNLDDESQDARNEACKNMFCRTTKPIFKEIAFTADHILARRVFNVFLRGLIRPGQKAAATKIIGDWRYRN